MHLKHKTTLMIAGIIAFVTLATTGAVGAGTHWFGLGYPHYSQHVIKKCNNMWETAMELNAMAQGSPAVQGEQMVKQAIAKLHQMKADNCPDGPYPLRNQ
jgi:hypothetical protein